jgi:hypothetical protein
MDIQNTKKILCQDYGIDPNIFNGEQINQIALGIDNPDVDITIYAKHEYNAKQMKQLRKGQEEGINVYYYANPEFNSEQMYYLKESAKKLKEKINYEYGVTLIAKPEFNNKQIKELMYVLDECIIEEYFDSKPIKPFLNSNLSYVQMQQGRFGLKYGIDIILYLKPEIPPVLMSKIKDYLINLKNFTSLADYQKIENTLKNEYIFDYIVKSKNKDELLNDFINNLTQKTNELKNKINNTTFNQNDFTKELIEYIENETDKIKEKVLNENKNISTLYQIADELERKNSDLANMFKSDIDYLFLQCPDNQKELQVNKMQNWFKNIEKVDEFLADSLQVTLDKIKKDVNNQKIKNANKVKIKN